LRRSARRTPSAAIAYETQCTSKGGYLIWIDRRVMDHLTAVRHRGEDLSDTIIRLAAGEAQR
jgi:hypothetical protein